MRQTEAKKTVRVLLAEDERELHALVGRTLSAIDIECDCVLNGKEAIDALSDNSYDIVITDLRMPVLDGMTLLEHVKRFYPFLDVLVITGYTRDYSFCEMIGRGASDFIEKPFLPDELLAKVKRILRERKLIRDFRREINSHLNARKEIERNLRTQEVVNNLLYLSIENDPVDQLLGKFLKHLTCLPWLELEPKGAVFLVGRENRGEPFLSMTAHFGMAEPLLDKCARISFGSCLCGRAAANKKVEFANCVDERHEITYQGMVQHGHYCVPILTRENDLLGVFTLYTRENALHKPQSEQMLTSIAGMVGAMLQRRMAAAGD